MVRRCNATNSCLIARRVGVVGHSAQLAARPAANPPKTMLESQHQLGSANKHCNESSTPPAHHYSATVLNAQAPLRTIIPHRSPRRSGKRWVTPHGLCSPRHGFAPDLVGDPHIWGPGIRPDPSESDPVPNPSESESISIGSKRPPRLQNSAIKSPAGLLGIGPNPPASDPPPNPSESGDAIPAPD